MEKFSIVAETKNNLDTKFYLVIEHSKEIRIFNDIERNDYTSYPTSKSFLIKLFAPKKIWKAKTHRSRNARRKRRCLHTQREAERRRHGTKFRKAASRPWKEAGRGDTTGAWSRCCTLVESTVRQRTRGLLRVRELRAEKFNSARAARASESSDTERYFPSSARRSTASQKRNADQLANRKRDRRFRALGINIRRRRVRAIEKTQLTKPAPLFGIKPGPLCTRNILSRAHAWYTW